MVEIGKEKELVGGDREFVVDSVPVIESSRKNESNLEVESWMEKIEKRFARIPKGVKGPQDDDVVVQPIDDTQSQQPPVKLPVTKTGMQRGSKSPVENSITWLVKWAKRRMDQLVRLGRRVILSEIPEIKK